MEYKDHLLKHVEQNKKDGQRGGEKIVELISGKEQVALNEEQCQMDAKVEQWIQDHIYIEIINQNYQKNQKAKSGGRFLSYENLLEKRQKLLYQK